MSKAVSSDMEGAICDECGQVVGPHGCCATIRALNQNRCDYRCYNGHIQTGIIKAIGILDDLQKKTENFKAAGLSKRGNPEFQSDELDNQVVEICRSKMLLANLLELASEGMAMHHGGAVEVELEQAYEDVRVEVAAQ